MELFENLSLNELMRPEGFDCECGVHHGVSLKYIKIARGAIRSLPEAVKAVGGSKPFIVCDKSTYAAAGEKAAAVLKEAGIGSTVFILSENGYFDLSYIREGGMLRNVEKQSSPSARLYGFFKGAHLFRG